MPTPRSVQRAWGVREAALTVTFAQPAGTSGSGRSPTTRPESRSSVSPASVENFSAYTANMEGTLSAGLRASAPVSPGVLGARRGHRGAAPRVEGRGDDHVLARL